MPYVRNKILPLFFGGISRSFELFLLRASGETAKEVAALVESGVITESLIDEAFPMEKAVEVCFPSCLLIVAVVAVVAI